MWIAGCQMVTMNCQTQDKDNFVHQAKYRDNGLVRPAPPPIDGCTCRFVSRIRCDVPPRMEESFLVAVVRMSVGRGHMPGYEAGPCDVSLVLSLVPAPDPPPSPLTCASCCCHQCGYVLLPACFRRPNTTFNPVDPAYVSLRLHSHIQDCLSANRYQVTLQSVLDAALA